MIAIEAVTTSAENRRLRRQRLAATEASGTATAQLGTMGEEDAEVEAPSAASVRVSGRRKWGESGRGLRAVTSLIAMPGEILDNSDDEVDGARLVRECLEEGRSALSESSRALEALQVGKCGTVGWRVEQS